MAIFKQKEFSSPSTKAIFRTKQAGNVVKSALKLAPKKSNVQVAREAIQLRNNLRNNLQPAAIKGRALDTAIGVVKKAETIKYYPGRAVNKGVRLLAENPAGVVTYVATAPLPVPSLIVSGAVNKAANKLPPYREVTQKLGKAWRNSAISRKIDGITGYDLSRFAQMVPM